jgi:hypothetical protein
MRQQSGSGVAPRVAILFIIVACALIAAQLRIQQLDARDAAIQRAQAEGLRRRCEYLGIPYPPPSPADVAAAKARRPTTAEVANDE